MKKLILTMNKKEFCETINFMYGIYVQVKNIDSSIHENTSPTLIAYLSYYNESYNEVFEGFVRDEALIAKNILLFIDILMEKYRCFSLDKSIELAYTAVKYKETREYFQMVTFPQERGKDIIIDILKSIKSDLYNIGE